MNLKEASEKNEKNWKKKINEKGEKKTCEYNVLSPPRHSKVHHDFCHCHFCRDDDQHHVLLPFSLQIVHLIYVSSHRHYHYPFPPFSQQHADEFDCYLCVCQ